MKKNQRDCLPTRGAEGRGSADTHGVLPKPYPFTGNGLLNCGSPGDGCPPSSVLGRAQRAPCAPPVPPTCPVAPTRRLAGTPRPRGEQHAESCARDDVR
jgi:hypothetical protein